MLKNWIISKRYPKFWSFFHIFWLKIAQKFRLRRTCDNRGERTVPKRRQWNPLDILISNVALCCTWICDLVKNKRINLCLEDTKRKNREKKLPKSATVQYQKFSLLQTFLSDTRQSKIPMQPGGVIFYPAYIANKNLTLQNFDTNSIIAFHNHTWHFIY